MTLQEQVKRAFSCAASADEGADAAIAVVLEAAAGEQPCTAENPDESAYQRGRFDAVMEFAAAIRNLGAPK